MPEANNETNEFLKSGKKLNEWTTEEGEITVIAPEIDEKNKRISFKATKEKVTEKVYYSNSTPRMVICKDHFMLPKEPHKYIFKCKRCDFHFHANTLTHKYNPENGKICLRSNGQVVI